MFEQKQLPKPLIYAIFVLSILVCLLAVTLVILIGALGFYGFDNATVISADCSNSTYFSGKGSYVNVALRTSFLASLISAIAAIILVVLLVLLIMKLCRGETIHLGGATKIGLYISSSITVLTAIPAAGSFLTFKVQLGSCNWAIYDETRVLIVAIIAMLLVGIGFILWILLLCAYSRDATSDEKYREVISQPTEPNENVKRSDYYERQRVEERQKVEERKQYIHEQTREHIYQQEIKKPQNYVYSKEIHNPPQGELNTYPKYDSRKKEAMPVYEKKDEGSPVKENQSYLSRNNNQPQNSRFNETYNSRYNKDSNVRYTPERGYAKETNEAELIFHRKKPETSKYEDALYKESKQYLSRQGGRSILNSEQVEERESKGSDFFRSGEAPGRNRSPPSNKPQREGMLLNYIRGKYAG